MLRNNDNEVVMCCGVDKFHWVVSSVAIGIGRSRPKQLNNGELYVGPCF